MLERLGYETLPAPSPGQALELFMAHSGRIALVITDVVMPEMNGRELAKRLKEVSPNLKTLFMSGYTADVIAQRGELESDTPFLQKPFTMRDLAVRVKQALESP
jgi:CheY-like chemotaxis protein